LPRGALPKPPCDVVTGAVSVVCVGVVSVGVVSVAVVSVGVVGVFVCLAAFE